MHNVTSIILKSFTNTNKFSASKFREMSNKCKVAVVQFTATNDKAHNLNTVTKLIKHAAENQAKVPSIYTFYE